MKSVKIICGAASLSKIAKSTALENAVYLVVCGNICNVHTTISDMQKIQVHLLWMSHLWKMDNVSARISANGSFTSLGVTALVSVTTSLNHNSFTY